MTSRVSVIDVRQGDKLPSDKCHALHLPVSSCLLRPVLLRLHVACMRANFLVVCTAHTCIYRVM